MYHSILKSLVPTSLVAVSFLSSACATFAQTVNHGSHHHLMIGVDNLPTLNSGIYNGLPNPNYNHLSLLFPHQHQPIETSGLHSIGIYSYTNSVTNPVINSTSRNNQLPEASSNLPPIPLVTGTGIFANQMISQQTDQNMYSDLKIRPLAHLEEDLSEPYVQAIYNAGNGRWNDLLGEDATIALELISITPDLQIVNNLGQNLFNGVGSRHLIGQGDYFSFTPLFLAPQSSQTKNYGATFRFLDVNTDNRTNWLPSGTFTINVQAEAVPESSNLLAFGIFVMAALISFKKR